MDELDVGCWAALQSRVDSEINSPLRHVLELVAELHPNERDVVCTWVSILTESSGEASGGGCRLQVRVTAGVMAKLDRVASQHALSRSYLLRFALSKVLASMARTPRYERQGDCATEILAIRVDAATAHQVRLRAERDGCAISDVLRAAVARAIQDSYAVKKVDILGRTYTDYEFWRDRLSNDPSDR